MLLVTQEKEQEKTTPTPQKQKIENLFSSPPL